MSSIDVGTARPRSVLRKRKRRTLMRPRTPVGLTGAVAPRATARVVGSTGNARDLTGDDIVVAASDSRLASHGTLLGVVPADVHDAVMAVLGTRPVTSSSASLVGGRDEATPVPMEMSQARLSGMLMDSNSVALVIKRATNTRKVEGHLFKVRHLLYQRLMLHFSALGLAIARGDPDAIAFAASAPRPRTRKGMRLYRALRRGATDGDQAPTTEAKSPMHYVTFDDMCVTSGLTTRNVIRDTEGVLLGMLLSDELLCVDGPVSRGTAEDVKLVREVAPSAYRRLVKVLTRAVGKEDGINQTYDNLRLWFRAPEQTHLRDTLFRIWQCAKGKRKRSNMKVTGAHLEAAVAECFDDAVPPTTTAAVVAVASPNELTVSNADLVGIIQRDTSARQEGEGRPPGATPDVTPESDAPLAATVGQKRTYDECADIAMVPSDGASMAAPASIAVGMDHDHADKTSSSSSSPPLSADAVLEALAVCPPPPKRMRCEPDEPSLTEALPANVATAPTHVGFVESAAVVAMPVVVARTQPSQSLPPPVAAIPSLPSSGVVVVVVGRDAIPTSIDAMSDSAYIGSAAEPYDAQFDTKRCGLSVEQAAEAVVPDLCGRSALAVPLDSVVEPITRSQAETDMSPSLPPSTTAGPHRPRAADYGLESHLATLPEHYREGFKEFWCLANHEARNDSSTRILGPIEIVLRLANEMRARRGEQPYRDPKLVLSSCLPAKTDTVRPAKYGATQAEREKARPAARRKSDTTVVPLGTYAGLDRPTLAAQRPQAYAEAAAKAAFSQHNEIGDPNKFYDMSDPEDDDDEDDDDGGGGGDDSDDDRVHSAAFVYASPIAHRSLERHCDRGASPKSTPSASTTPEAVDTGAVIWRPFLISVDSGRPSPRGSCTAPRSATRPSMGAPPDVYHRWLSAEMRQLRVAPGAYNCVVGDLLGDRRHDPLANLFLWQIALRQTLEDYNGRLHNPYWKPKTDADEAGRLIIDTTVPTRALASIIACAIRAATLLANSDGSSSGGGGGASGDLNAHGKMGKRVTYTIVRPSVTVRADPFHRSDGSVIHLGKEYARVLNRSCLETMAHIRYDVLTPNTRAFMVNGLVDECCASFSNTTIWEHIGSDDAHRSGQCSGRASHDSDDVLKTVSERAAAGYDRGSSGKPRQESVESVSSDDDSDADSDADSGDNGSAGDVVWVSDDESGGGGVGSEPETDDGNASDNVGFAGKQVIELD